VIVDSQFFSRKHVPQRDEKGSLSIKASTFIRGTEIIEFTVGLATVVQKSERCLWLQGLTIAHVEAILRIVILILRHFARDFTHHDPRRNRLLSEDPSAHRRLFDCYSYFPKGLKVGPLFG
jgi:hypothetical protein